MEGRAVAGIQMGFQRRPEDSPKRPHAVMTPNFKLKLYFSRFSFFTRLAMRGKVALENSHSTQLSPVNHAVVAFKNIFGKNDTTFKCSIMPKVLQFMDHQSITFE
jgi:hypothetical protein